MPNDTAKRIIPLHNRGITCNPGSEFEFQCNRGYFEGQPGQVFEIYRIPGGEWQLTKPYRAGSAFSTWAVSDPL